MVGWCDAYVYYILIYVRFSLYSDLKHLQHDLRLGRRSKTSQGQVVNNVLASLKVIFERIESPSQSIVS